MIMSVKSRSSRILNVAQRRLDHCLRCCGAVLFQQILFQRSAVDTDANRHLLGLRGAHYLDDAFVLADVAGIQTQLVDAGFEGQQRQFVMEMNIGNQGYLGHALANLFQRYCCVVVGHSQAHDFATGADHLFDLRYGGADVGRVRLGHRLDRNRRAAANLHVLNLNCSGLSHNYEFIRFSTRTCPRRRDEFRLKTTTH